MEWNILAYVLIVLAIILSVLLLISASILYKYRHEEFVRVRGTRFHMYTTFIAAVSLLSFSALSIHGILNPLSNTEIDDSKETQDSKKMYDSKKI